MTIWKEKEFKMHGPVIAKITRVKPQKSAKRAVREISLEKWQKAIAENK